MANKKFFPAFKPPRYVAGNSRHYINIYYTNRGGERVHEKPTFDLNRIHDLRKRRERGLELEAKLYWWLCNKKYLEDFEEHQVPKDYEQKEVEDLSRTNIVQAVQWARDWKMNATNSHTSKLNIKSDAKTLLGYLEKKDMEWRMIGSFQKKEAMAYLMHYLTDRGVKNKTYNGLIGKYRKLFAVLVEMGYLKENPFQGIKRLPEEEKEIRPFEEHEAKLLLEYLRKNDLMLFYGAIIQLGCFIRPNAVRQLKFQDIDLEKGVIRAKGNSVKTARSKYPTIPDELLKYFREEHFQKYPGNYYVFGAEWKPNPHKAIAKGRMSEKFRHIRDRLIKEGQLDAGVKKEIKWYSWKYYGMTLSIDQVGLVATQIQADHLKPSTTIGYMDKKKINKKMKGVKLIKIK